MEAHQGSEAADADGGLDLHLEWVNGPPDHRRSLAPIVERPEIEPFRSEPFGREPVKGDRMRLVLALGQSEVELRGAIDAIDARAVGDLTGGMEEVREYLAAAFDAVRELTGQLVTLTDRLALAPGRPPSEHIARAAESGEHIARAVESGEHSAPPPPPPSAPEVDAHLHESADRIERALIRITSTQTDMLAEIERLADEVESYRRRVQVHARPPVITDAQVDEIVERVTGVVPPKPQPQPEETEKPKDKLSWRERRAQRTQEAEAQAADAREIEQEEAEEREAEREAEEQEAEERDAHAQEAQALDELPSTLEERVTAALKRPPKLQDDDPAPEAPKTPRRRRKSEPQSEGSDAE